jgi:predicted membrane-bound mannosyltransferase
VLSGRWKPGSNVDEAVFDATFEALAREPHIVSADAARAYHEAWAKASDATRLDAVIAHEYAELKTVATPELQAAYGTQWPHYAAIKNAPSTTLKISEEARELLRLQANALGL